MLRANLVDLLLALKCCHHACHNNCCYSRGQGSVALIQKAAQCHPKQLLNPVVPARLCIQQKQTAKSLQSQGKVAISWKRYKLGLCQYRMVLTHLWGSALWAPCTTHVEAAARCPCAPVSPALYQLCQWDPISQSMPSPIEDDDSAHALPMPPCPICQAEE